MPARCVDGSPRKNFPVNLMADTYLLKHIAPDGKRRWLGSHGLTSLLKKAKRFSTMDAASDWGDAWNESRGDGFEVYAVRERMALEG